MASAKPQCGACQQPVFRGDAYCVSCGTRVDPVLEGPTRAEARAAGAFAAGGGTAGPPCPRCATRSGAADSYCGHCGHGLNPAEAAPPVPPTACASCSASLYPDDTFCVGCGHRVGHGAPALVGSSLAAGTRVQAAVASGRTNVTPGCPNCGTPIVPDEEYRFCQSCGARVAGGDPSAAGGGSGPRPGADGKPQRPVGDPWSETRRKLVEATLGEYDLAHELGRGGMAAVYLAHDIALNRKVAIKVMAPGLLTGIGMVERFSREAQTVANLSHANIIQIHTVRHVDDLHFFVMKYVEGNSLLQVLDAVGPLPFPVVRQVLYQVGSGLGYAHRRGIVHRDIKPANILIDTDGQVVVMDFGIAKVTHDAATTGTGMTQAGAVMGTPAYMSPEQCYAAPITWAADQYSLGIVGYEMLTGYPPFGGTPFAVMQAHTQERPPPIRATRRDCPAALEAAVMRMLAKPATERFPTLAGALEAADARPAGESDPVRSALRALAQVKGDPARKGRPQTPRSPIPGIRPSIGERRPARRTPWVVGGGAALVAAAAVAVTLIRRVGEGPSPPPSAPAVAPVASLTLSTQRDSVLVGATVSIQASATDAAGRAVSDRPIEWRASDSTVARVEGAGIEATITGRRPGRVVVSATIEGQRQVAEVVVTAARAGSLPVSSDSAIRGPRASAITLVAPAGPLVAGGSARIRIQVAWEGRTAGNATAAQWRTSDPAVATINASDLAGATISLLKAGDVTVIAELNGVRGTVGLQVRGLTAVAIDLSRGAVTLSGTAGGPAVEEAITVVVRGADDPPAVGPVSYQGPGSGWLTPLLQGAILTLRATPRDLAADTHRATVSVSAGSTSRELVVTFAVAAPTSAPTVAGADLASAHEELQAVLDRYARALVARDSAEIRAVYPAISARGLTDVLRGRLAEQYEIQLRRNVPLRPGGQPDTIEGEVSAGVFTGGGSNVQRLVYVFARSGIGWRISAIRPR